MTTKRENTDLDSVQLTVGNVMKFAAIITFCVAVAGSYWSLYSRQEAFEKTQTIQHLAIVEQLAELKEDAQLSKTLINDMRITLERTNTILEQIKEK